MKYVIMCGGKYSAFKEPKALSIVNGEPLVKRTIRLLRDNGVDEIYITSNDKRFDGYGVQRLEHENSFVENGSETTGYWLDAFYPHFEADNQVCYLFGDVYFTDDAIKRIVNFKTDKDILFGTSAAKNPQHKNWGEPFAYIVNDYAGFMNGVNAVKELYDSGKTARHPIVWELYRYLNGLDVNIQDVLDETFVCIDDGTMDIDSPEQIEKMNKEFKR